MSITQNHTSSLEDHGRKLTTTIGQVTQMIANAKATGVVRRMMPTSPTKSAAAAPASPNKPGTASAAAVVEATVAEEEMPATLKQSDYDLSDTEFDKMERKFTDLKTSIVEKCQSSKS